MGQPSTVKLTAKPPLAMGLRINLSVMMFLQYGIWGSWFVLMGKYLQNLDPDRFNNAVVGDIYGTMALGTIVAPLFVGQIADRFFASEKLMAVLHLAGAGLLYWMGQIHDPTTFYWVALVYALVYSPTLALSNAIAFAHVPDGNRDFPGLRVLGTVGWIAANWIVAVLLMVKAADGQLAMPNALFVLAAVFSATLGILSLCCPIHRHPGKRVMLCRSSRRWDYSRISRLPCSLSCPSSLPSCWRSITVSQASISKKVLTSILRPSSRSERFCKDLLVSTWMW